MLLVLLLPARVRDARGWLHISLPKGLSSPSVSWNDVGSNFPSAASRRKRRYRWKVTGHPLRRCSSISIFVGEGVDCDETSLKKELRVGCKQKNTKQHWM